MTTVIQLIDAQRHVWSHINVLPAVTLPLNAAVGCSLANDVIAAESVPPFANSAVDGWAVRAGDTAGAPIKLRVLGAIAAGAVADVDLEPGSAIKIMTGAPMPIGADAVVMVEDSVVDSTGASVEVLASVGAGQSIRSAGSDVREGQVVFRSGAAITPAVAGVLASINANFVTVTRKARIGVLSTGDELVDDGSPLAPGQIRESNKVMLLKLVAAAGAEPIDFGIIKDDEAALETALRTAVDQCDAVLTSGGVSMGDYDVVKAVLSRIASMAWMQIAIRPAKPFAFGVLSNTSGVEVPIFGLPGNPVSSMVSFELIARPAIRQMMNLEPFRPTVLAIADDDMRREPDGKTHWNRVFAKFDEDGYVHVTSTGPQGSHQLAATSIANALAMVEDGQGVYAGDRLEVMLLSDWS